MACSCLLSTEKSKEWLRCWRAIYIVNAGLSSFVEQEIKLLHEVVLRELPKESKCCQPQNFHAGQKCDVRLEKNI